MFAPATEFGKFCILSVSFYFGEQACLLSAAAANANANASFLHSNCIAQMGLNLCNTLAFLTCPGYSVAA